MSKMKSPKKKGSEDTAPSAEEIAEAVSARMKRDAYWAEVDAYYRERAKR